MPQFASLSGKDDRAQLQHFVEYFLAVVEEIIQKKASEVHAVPPKLFSKNLLPEDLESLFRDAWLVCRERDVPPLVEEIKTVPIQELQRHGLVGVELKAKLASLSRISQWLWAKPTLKALKKLLDMIDSLFESLVEAIPGGHGLAELKEAIENLLPED
ncbi:hypothetical protein [Bradyrhizobium sp. CCGUVB14]|uniref:hypothetical protein n=1 Tax=Bradyrhizobium sp. CCGUVB14 TaxID=2949628 RepID=UPI0020B3EF51|nr:hypothetical protein [Bradyrhizobium sp. CCGUVB14]MCP3439926.1 hypothetical protein [Bradyrhizobium sp. CCGUVB14]